MVTWASPPPRYAWSPSSAWQGRIDASTLAPSILPRLRGRGTAEGGRGGVYASAMHEGF